MASIDLPDVNVWIALSTPNHPHRNRAEQYWRQEAAPEIVFSTITMLGLVRICSSAPLFDGSKLSTKDAWEIYRAWIQKSGIEFLTEPPASIGLLDSFVFADLVTGRTCTDAYLAAFALAGSLRLVSFDKDFSRFSGLDFLHLS